MSYDIHLHIEVKIDDEWHHWKHPRVRRNYSLFAKMAGVRSYKGEIEPLSPPKGLPDDVTAIVAFHSMHWRAGGHSHSYLVSEEVEQLAAWCVEQAWGDDPLWFEETFGFLFGNLYKSLHKYPSDYPEGVQDYRFVFWFDN